MDNILKCFLLIFLLKLVRAECPKIVFEEAIDNLKNGEYSIGSGSYGDVSRVYFDSSDLKDPKGISVWFDKHNVTSNKSEKIVKPAAIKSFRSPYSGTTDFNKEKNMLIEISKNQNSEFAPKFYGCGETSDKKGFIMMEYIDNNLKTFIEQDLDYSSLDDPNDENACIRLTQQIFTISYNVIQTLFNAHKAGIVHCDLKPENIGIKGGEKAVLIDLGSAIKYESNKDKEVSLCPVGSLGYTAPEVVYNFLIKFEGKNYSRVKLNPKIPFNKDNYEKVTDNSLSDVYSIGIVLLDLALNLKISLAKKNSDYYYDADVRNIFHFIMVQDDRLEFTNQIRELVNDKISSNIDTEFKADKDLVSRWAINSLMQILITTVDNIPSNRPSSYHLCVRVFILYQALAEASLSLFISEEKTEKEKAEAIAIAEKYATLIRDLPTIDLNKAVTNLNKMLGTTSDTENTCYETYLNDPNSNKRRLI